MIDIVQIGLGPLGRKIVRYAVERGCFNIVAAVDPAPDIAGKDLGELCEIDPLGVMVQPTLEKALAGKSARVAVLTTVSSLVKLVDQVREIAAVGLHIVSTCEELFYPFKTQPGPAAEIDRICTENNVACLGTGVNPGFLMDFLPTVLSGVCQNVESVQVARVQDASIRRIPFQQKIGAALTLEQFEAKHREGALRHVGLPESVDFLAARFGFDLDDSTESLEPVIAETDITTGYAPISKGMARGVQQIGRGFTAGKEVITLTFRAAVGEPEAYDEITIRGEPTIHSRIAGGVNGDIATCAITLNAVRSILSAAPGLRTMSEVAAPTFFKKKD